MLLKWIPNIVWSRSSHQRCSIKKGILENSPEVTRKHLYWRDCNFIKKVTLAQVFSCELCKSFKNTFFTEYLRATVSVGRTSATQFSYRFTARKIEIILVNVNK